jgi:rod shape-determining protein MreD
VNLLCAFALALIAAFFGTALLPSVRLIAFAPFLAIVYMRKSFITSLWIACLCGFIIDLLASQMRFGVYGLNYCATTVILYHQRRHFFEDKSLALAIYTALISCVTTALQMIVFQKGVPFNLKLLVTDLIGMPILDACYVFLWFTCPIKGYHQLKKIGWRSLLLRRNETSG